MGKRLTNSGNLFLIGSSNHGRQQNSLDVLRRLVYTAARIGAGEFIRMLFSTSARRIVLKAYKNRCPLPEDIADANGHYEIATYLRSATERCCTISEDIPKMHHIEPKMIFDRP